MTTLPELTKGPVVLWRLDGVEQHELVCEVRAERGILALKLYDSASGWTLISEPYEELEPLMHRSNRMFGTCLAEGWREPCGEDAVVRS